MSDFLYAKFDGSRFDTHMLPYELLPDIHAYAVLIERLAQHLYRTNNNRRRIPKEFKEKFNLRLGKFENGSTIAPLVRELPPGYGEDEANSDEYSVAKNMVNNVLKAMEQGQPIPNDFPAEIIPLFNNFGKNLHTGESIYFSSKNSFLPTDQIFKYDKNVRLTLITTGKSDYKGSCNVLGKLDGLEVRKKKIKLIVNDETEIPISFNNTFASSIRNLHHELEKYDVRVFGLASYRKDDTISSIDDVQHITIYEGANVTSAPSIPSRIDEIKKLQAGWYQPDEGDAFDETKLNLIQNTLQSLIQDEQPAPFIYPTPDNEISCEWNIGTWDVSATFDLTEDKVFLHALNHSNNETRSRETDIGDSTQLATTLSDFLTEFLPQVDDE